MGRESYWDEDPSPLLRVSAGYRLAGADPGGHPGIDVGKSEGRKLLAEGARILADRQELLYASSRLGDRRRILLVLQATDSAGKGGIVKHVIGAVQPGGVDLTSFKAPSDEEREHDFLWRINRATPAAGVIGVFDRSHYEDVLIGRVRELAPIDEIERRYEAINDFERNLAATGTTIIKVMLHISRDEQRARLLDRLNRPDKHWKFNPADIDEREAWGDYEAAYQLVFDRTSTPYAPWHVVPANRKWYARLAVQHLIIDALEAMELEWPEAAFDVESEKARLAASR